MRTPTRFRAETKFTKSTEKKANVNLAIMAAVGNGDGATAAVAGRDNWFHIRLLDDDNRLTQARCQLALSYDDLIYVAKAKDRNLTYYEFVAFIQDTDGETEVPVCPKFAQVVYVSENSCQFAAVSEAVTYINALATGPLATRLFLIKVQAGNFAETGDVTIPQYVSLEGVGEASEIEMGANTLFLDSDTSLESLVVESSDPVAAIGVIAEDNVVMRDVRCIQTAAAGTPDCFYLNANTNVYLYNCIAEVAQNGAGYHVVNDDAVMYLCTALSDTYSATTYGFQVSGVASVELYYCIADDDTNFGDGLHLDAAGLTCATRWCNFAGADDDVNTGATSTWQHFATNFDPANSTIGGTETALTHGLTNFADGVEFTGATTVNIIAMPDALADALHVIDDTTGINFQQFVTTAGAQANVFNIGEADVDFRVAASGITNALFVRGSDGYVGVGVLGLSANLDVIGSATAGTRSLLLRSGDASAPPADSHQIIFGFGGTNDYLHSIRTRHEAAADAGNAIDFYVWDWGTDAVDNTPGTNLVMTLNGGNVGIGAITPNYLADATVTVMSILGPAPNGAAAIELVTPDAGAGAAIIGKIEFLNLDGGAAIVSRAIIAGVRDGADDAIMLDFYTEPAAGGVTKRLTIGSTGHVYPTGNKTQDLGLAPNRWREIFSSLALNTGTSRLVPVQKNCAVDGTQLVRSTGGLRVLGEESDWLLAFCPTCGTVAMEELKHRIAPATKTAPKVVLTGMEVLKNSGNTKSVTVNFRYGNDVEDELGTRKAPHNSTTLSDDELAAFLRMADDKERRAFLLELGQIEWNALEKMKAIEPELDNEQAQIDLAIRELVGKDLSKEITNGKPN